MGAESRRIVKQLGEDEPASAQLLKSRLHALPLPSMVLLKNNKRNCRVCAIPQGCKVTVFAGKLVENNSRFPRKVGLNFTLPEQRNNPSMEYNEGPRRHRRRRTEQVQSRGTCEHLLW